MKSVLSVLIAFLAFFAPSQLLGETFKGRIPTHGSSFEREVRALAPTSQKKKINGWTERAVLAFPSIRSTAHKGSKFMLSVSDDGTTVTDFRIVAEWDENPSPQQPAETDENSAPQLALIEAKLEKANALIELQKEQLAAAAETQKAQLEVEAELRALLAAEIETSKAHAKKVEIVTAAIADLRPLLEAAKNQQLVGDEAKIVSTQVTSRPEKSEVADSDENAKKEEKPVKENKGNPSPPRKIPLSVILLSLLGLFVIVALVILFIRRRNRLNEFENILNGNNDPLPQNGTPPDVNGAIIHLKAADLRDVAPFPVRSDEAIRKDAHARLVAGRQKA